MDTSASISLSEEVKVGADNYCWGLNIEPVFVVAPPSFFVPFFASCDTGGGAGYSLMPGTPVRSATPSSNPQSVPPVDTPVVSADLAVFIDGHPVTALVDTGADFSIISQKLSDILNKVKTS